MHIFLYSGVKSNFMGNFKNWKNLALKEFILNANLPDNGVTTQDKVYFLGYLIFQEFNTLAG